MGEIKQTNFRIDSERADAFRAFCEEQGMNQAQGFDHLMQILQLDQAKAVTPERLVEIEEFELHVKAILDGYLKSLEVAKLTEERVLEQFRRKLESKDKVIEDLQAKIAAKEELAAVASTAALEAENKQIQAEENERIAKERMEAAEKTALDKAAIAEMLSAKLAEAEDKLKDYPALRASEADLRAKLRESDQFIKDIKKDAEIERERLTATIQQEMDKALAAAAKAKDKAVADLDRKKEKQISALSVSLSRAETSAAERTAQIEKLELQLQQEMDKWSEKVEQIRDERDAFKQEVSLLKVELEKLNEQLQAFQKKAK